MAEAVGFEPTSLLRDYLISSQGRYDHFDTLPYIKLINALGNVPTSIHFHAIHFRVIYAGKRVIYIAKRLYIIPKQKSRTGFSAEK